MSEPCAKTKKTPLDVNQLREVLTYDPETGNFTWISGPKVGLKAGNTNHRGYTSLWHKGVQYSAHRLAWEWMAGDKPSGDIDHINQIKSDNRFTNLRQATRSENMFNRGKNPNNTSGFKGVIFCHDTGRWRARAMVDRKSVCMGRFDTPEEAHAAYLAGARKHRGDFVTC